MEKEDIPKLKERAKETNNPQDAQELKDFVDLCNRFEKKLHGLLIYRLDEAGNRIEKPWRDGTDAFGKNAMQPTRFEYQKFELHNIARVWWTQGFDPKWYLSPFPQNEINKGYGLIQNPGW